MAQLVIAAAGAAVGSFFGPLGTQIGWALGSVLGASFGPKQKSEGPRLNDLRVSGTEYGQPIPYVFGHPRVAGQLIWSSIRREIATATETGKGGGSEFTSFTYECDVYFLLAGNEGDDFTRVWNNGGLVYTRLTGSDPDSIAASNETDLWQRITFYGGASDQLPDPSYETAVGAGNAPAYRGRQTVFIQGLQLGSSGQIPNLTFELAVVAGPTAGSTSTMGTIPSSYLYGAGPLLANDDGVSIGVTVHVLAWTVASPGVSVTVYRMKTDGALTVQTTYSVGNPEAIPFPGNSDVSILLILHTASISNQTFKIYDEDGFVVMTFTIVSASTDIRYAYKEGIVYVGLAQNSPADIFRVVAGTVTHTVLEYGVQAMACDGTYVYALQHQGTNIDQFLAADLSSVGTISVPIVSPQTTIFTDEDNTLWLTGYVGLGAKSLYRYNGATWTLVNDDLGLASPEDQVGTVKDRLTLFAGTLYRYALPHPAQSGVGTVYRATTSISPEDATLEDVVTTICELAGMDAAEFDTSDLATVTRPVRAFCISQVAAARSPLEILSAMYFFECTVSDKVYFVVRGGSSVATLTFDQLGAGEDNSTVPFELTVNNEIETPAQEAITYSNVDSDYNTDTQFSDRLLSAQGSNSTIQVALGMTASEAKGVADAHIGDQASSIASAPIALAFRHAKIEPTDIVTVIDEDGNSFRMRVTKKSDGGGVLRYDTVIDNASVLISAGITSDDYTSTTTVDLPQVSDIELLDVPILRDIDDASGIYVAAKFGNASGTAVYSSTDDVTFGKETTATENSVFGNCTTTLGSWTGSRVFDETSTVTVSIADDTLSSSTRDALLNDQTINAALVGSEVLQFRNAVLQSAGIYKLSGLLRGSRGTEWAMTGHVAGERFVLLSATALRRINVDTSRISVERFYKGVTLGRRLSSADSEPFTDTGVDRMPFSPFDVRVSRDGSNNATITWQRRTRLNVRAIGAAGISVPIGEDSEAYSIDVFANNTFATVVRIIETTAPTASYTAAQQTADGLTPGAHLSLRVYQLSATIGRGYPVEAET